MIRCTGSGRINRSTPIEESSGPYNPERGRCPGRDRPRDHRLHRQSAKPVWNARPWWSPPSASQPLSAAAGRRDGGPGYRGPGLRATGRSRARAPRRSTAPPTVRRSPRAGSGWIRSSWRFHLRPGARWQDGRPVTAEDVRFSFEAFGDSVLDAPARPYLGAPAHGRAGGLRDRTRPVRGAVARAALRRHLPRPRHPEPHLVRDAAGELAVRHQRGAPRGQRPVPGRRVETWRVRAPGRRQLAAGAARRPAGDLAVRDRSGRRAEPRAEPRGRPARDGGRPRSAAERVARDSTLRLVPYASATYGFLGFQDPRRRRGTGRIRSSATRPPGARWRWRSIGRRWRARCSGARPRLRRARCRSCSGSGTTASPRCPFDTVARRPRARRGRVAPGRTATSRAQRGSRALAFDILVPSTSPTRRQLAVALQAMWQAVGAAVTVTAVDFPVFQERLGQGQFDSYIGAWLDEPSPRGLADQWTRAGWDGAQLRALRQPRIRRAVPAGRPGATWPGRAGSTARRWTRSTPTRRRSSSTRPPTRRSCPGGCRAWRSIPTAGRAGCGNGGWNSASAIAFMNRSGNLRGRRYGRSFAYP